MKPWVAPVHLVCQSADQAAVKSNMRVGELRKVLLYCDAWVLILQFGLLYTWEYSAPQVPYER